MKNAESTWRINYNFGEFLRNLVNDAMSFLNPQISNC